MKPVDVKSNAYTKSSEEINDKYHVFKVGDNVRISKYNNVFAKGYTGFPNWSEKVFMIKEVKNTAPWQYFISDLNGEEIVGIFYENKLQKIFQKELRIEKNNQEKK